MITQRAARRTRDFCMMWRRWRLPAREALDLGGDEAVLELSRALALVRPQAPAWSFAPVPSAINRVRGDGTQWEGDTLSLEVAITLVKRRTPGEGGWQNEGVTAMVHPNEAQRRYTAGSYLSSALCISHNPTSYVPAS